MPTIQGEKMKNIQLLVDVEEYRKGDVITVSDKDAKAMVNEGLAELHDVVQLDKDFPDDSKELFADPPVPPIPENLNRSIDDALITVTAVKAVWINEGGQVVRKDPGESFDMLPELAEGLLTLGVVKQ